MGTVTLTQDEIDRRVILHEAEAIVELCFADLRLDSSTDVNRFFDHVEDRISESGEELWFFLLDYREMRIDNSAWFAFGKRGKEISLAHAMGWVRFDESEITKRQIERSIGTEAFDPDMCFDRDSALARLAELPSVRRKKIVHVPNFTRDELIWRLEFLPEDGIMCVDFSGMSFEHSRDVNDVYDFVEEQIKATGRKWYFLVNYEGTRIQSPAWVQYAKRGKALNAAWSLGSVRYAPGSETEADIRLRAESQGFRPNIRNTQEEALERIAEMKAEAAAASEAG